MEFEKVHLVISNYNSFPQELLSISGDWTLYDQSDDLQVIQKLKELGDERVIFCGKTLGHNLVNYLDYIIENYESLPKTIAFLKNNIVGRHCTREWLMQSLDKRQYTFLYLDPNLKEKDGIQYQLYPSKFLEINNSWYAWSHPHKYFVNLNEFLSFLFVDYKPSRYILFSPGACYVVERWRILRHPKSFYQGLKMLIGYDFRTTEAFFLERSLNIIFDGTYTLREYAGNTRQFRYAISQLPDRTNESKPERKSKKLSLLAGKIIAICKKFV